MLPPPDIRVWPSGSHCIIVDDGTDLPHQIKDRLSGWETRIVSTIENAHADAVIYLHPQTNERTAAKSLFLGAKTIQTTALMAVTRIDGTLGVTTGYADYAGGIFGLIKTLRLEWPQVFCRALDLQPSLPIEDMATAIIAELHDPNRRLVEVGYGMHGRVTLTSQELV